MIGFAMAFKGTPAQIVSTNVCSTFPKTNKPVTRINKVIRADTRSELALTVPTPIKAYLYASTIPDIGLSKATNRHFSGIEESG